MPWISVFRQVLSVFQAKRAGFGDPPGAVDKFTGEILVIYLAEAAKIDGVLKAGFFIDINESMIAQLLAEIGSIG